MATAHPRTTRRHEAMHGEEPSGKRGRFRRRFITLLVLIVLLVACAPMITATTGLRHLIANAALGEGQGTLRIGSASLGWFSSVELTNVDWRDADGDRMLLVPKLTLDRSLGQLLLGATQLGTVRLAEPEFNVRLRKDGSNVEDALAPWLEPTETTTRVSIVVEVEDGKITVHDTPSGRTWHVEPLAVSFAMAADDQTPTTLSMKATTPKSVATQPPREGQIEINLHLAPQGESHLAIYSQTLPLAIFESVVARTLPLAHLAGSLTSQLDITWRSGAAPRGFALSGQIAFEPLEISGVGWGQDQLRFSRLEVPCKLQLQGDRLQVEQLLIRCDVGELSAQGDLSIGDFGQGDFELSGRLDLARLAQMVPGVLNIREGTTITGGTAELALRANREGATQRWDGSIATRELTGNVDGRQIAWDQPIRLELAAAQNGEADELTLERLTCQSDFFQLQAAGDLQQLTATGNFDLGRLADRLGQFIDLDAWQMAGAGEARLDWSLDRERRFRAGGSFSLRQFALAGPDRTAWREPSLTVQADAAGLLSAEAYRVDRLESASAQLSAAEDRLEVRYVPTGGDDSPDGSPRWPLQVTLQGNLASWQTRLADIAPLDGWVLGGQVHLTAQAIYSPDALSVSEAKLQLANVTAQGPTHTIVEPQVDLIGSGRWDIAQSQLDIASLQLTSSAVGARMEKTVVDFSQALTPQVTGQLAFQVALDRLQRWFPPDQQPAGYVLAGNVTGNVQIDSQSTTLSARVDATGRDVALWRLGSPAPTAQAPGARTADTVVWQEPAPTLSLAVTYDLLSDRLLLESTDLKSQVLQVTASGKIDELGGQQDVDVEGKINLDLAAVIRLLPPQLGSNIELVGYDAARFKVRGPLAPDIEGVGGDWSQYMTAETDFAWESGSLFGLPIGPAKLQVQLQDGQIRLSPIDLQIGEGRLTAAPQIRLAPGPAVLSLPAGPLVQDIHLTPEVTDLVLKYIAPVLANATRTDGRFSVALRGATIPLGDSQRANVDGQLTVHSVQVTPGPLAEEFILLAEQVEAVMKRRPPLAARQRPQRTLLTVEDHKVDFQLVDGRVHHRDMAFQVGEVTVHTSGSVGLDQTLALQLDIPLPEKWTTGGPLRENLRGQSVKIPVRGTLARPKVDGRAVASLGEQLLRGALQGTINNEVNNLLDRLLPPKR